jgi:hypothetical protein
MGDGARAMDDLRMCKGRWSMVSMGIYGYGERFMERGVWVRKERGAFEVACEF